MKVFIKASELGCDVLIMWLQLSKVSAQRYCGKVSNSQNVTFVVAIATITLEHYMLTSKNMVTFESSIYLMFKKM